MVFSKLKATFSPSFWDNWSRFTVGVAVAGAVVSLACNVVSSVYFLRAATFFDDAVGTSVTTPQHNATRDAAVDTATQGAKTSAFQFGFEACMLPIVIVLYVVVGVASARRIKHVITASGGSSISMKSLSSHGGSATETPLHLLRRIVGTCTRQHPYFSAFL